MTKGILLFCFDTSDTQYHKILQRSIPLLQKNLQLDIKKAKSRLDWYPTYSVKKGVQITTEWYKYVFKDKEDPFKVTKNQILGYMNENNWR